MPRQVTVSYSCDVCGASIADPADAYSFALAYAHTGKGQKPITEENQPFGCTPEHAVQAAKTAIDRLEQQRQQPA